MRRLIAVAGLLGLSWALPVGAQVVVSPPTSVPNFAIDASKVTAGAGTVQGNGVLTRGIYTSVLTQVNFSAAALTADATIATLPARTRLVSILADVTVKFIGGGVTAATMTCGKTAGGAEYLVSFNVFAAAITRGLVDADLGTSINRANAVQGGDLTAAMWTGATTVQCRLTTVTANTNALTQGTVLYSLVTEALP